MKIKLILVIIGFISFVLLGYFLVIYPIYLLDRVCFGKIDLNIDEVRVELPGKKFRISDKKAIEYFKKSLQNIADKPSDTKGSRYNCLIQFNFFMTADTDIIILKNKKGVSICLGDIWYKIEFEGEMPDQIKELLVFLED